MNNIGHKEKGEEREREREKSFFDIVSRMIMTQRQIVKRQLTEHQFSYSPLTTNN